MQRFLDYTKTVSQQLQLFIRAQQGDRAMLSDLPSEDIVIHGATLMQEIAEVISVINEHDKNELDIVMSLVEYAHKLVAARQTLTMLYFQCLHCGFGDGMPWTLALYDVDVIGEGFRLTAGLGLV